MAWFAGPATGSTPWPRPTVLCRWRSRSSRSTCRQARKLGVGLYRRLNPMAGLAGRLHRMGIDHPWLTRATDWCYEPGWSRASMKTPTRSARCCGSSPTSPTRPGPTRSAPTSARGSRRQWYRADATDPSAGDSRHLLHRRTVGRLFDMPIDAHTSAGSRATSDPTVVGPSRRTAGSRVHTGVAGHRDSSETLRTLRVRPAPQPRQPSSLRRRSTGRGCTPHGAQEVPDRVALHQQCGSHSHALLTFQITKATGATRRRAYM